MKLVKTGIKYDFDDVLVPIDSTAKWFPPTAMNHELVFSSFFFLCTLCVHLQHRSERSTHTTSRSKTKAERTKAGGKRLPHFLRVFLTPPHLRQDNQLFPLSNAARPLSSPTHHARLTVLTSMEVGHFGATGTACAAC